MTNKPHWPPDEPSYVTNEPSGGSGNRQDR